MRHKFRFLQDGRLQRRLVPPSASLCREPVRRRLTCGPEAAWPHHELQDVEEWLCLYRHRLDHFAEMRAADLVPL